MKLKLGTAVDVVRAERAGPLRLKLTFSDGHVSEVDLGPFLRSSLNPETRQFLDEKRFLEFSLIQGNVVWGDYSMCFAIEDLYDGSILHASPAAQARAVAEERTEYVAKTGKHGRD